MTDGLHMVETGHALSLLYHTQVIKPLKTMKSTILSLSFLLIVLSGHAQIIAPDTVCVNEPVVFRSADTSTNHVTYAWEFITSSMSPILTPAIPVPGTGTNGTRFNTVDQVTMVYDTSTGNYHAFAGSHGSMTVQRMDFGQNPNSIPIVTDLGNPGGAFNNSAGNLEAVEIVKDDNGDWFIFFTNGTLVRWELGPNIANNSPVATRLTLSGQGMPMQLAITKFNGEWVGFAGHHWLTNITRYDFGNSLANIPTVQSLPGHGMLSSPDYFALHKQGGEWYMLITNLSANNTVRYHFGLDLKNNNPTAYNLGNTSNFNSLNRSVTTINSCNGFFALLMNQNGSVGKLDFPQSDITSNSPAVTPLGQIYGTGVAMQMFKPYWYNDTLWAISGSFNNNASHTVYRFPLVTIPSGNAVVKYYDPVAEYTFTSPGVYDVSLYMDQGDPKGPFAYCKQIVVVSGRNNLLGPDTVVCDGTSYTLDATQTGAAGYTWSTGETTPSIVVTTPGTYSVQVSGQVCGTDDTVTVDFVSTPVVDLGADLDACDGDAITIGMGGGSSQYVYSWSTGASVATIPVTASGSYSLVVSDRGCTDGDTVMLTFHPSPEVNLGADTNLCMSALPYVLTSVQPSGSHYLWSNGLSTNELSVMQSGRYWLQVDFHGCTSSDTIYITAIPDPHVYIGADSTICEQTPARIGTEIAGASYSWNAGETTPYIHVSETGDYILSVNLDGCVVPDTISIIAMPDPDIDLGDDGDICPEQTIVFDGSYGTNSIYEWSTGETTPSISVAEAGIYSVVVTSEHKCVGGDTISLNYYPKPTVSLGVDTTVCEETPLHLSAWALNTDSLRWSDGSYGSNLMIRYGGEYIVTAINKCGTNSDTITVKQIFCDIWLPNAFTPNSDGVNDVFRILGNLGRLEGVTLSVFNRWGERVYITNDKLQGWDGYYKGSAAQMGTYVYLLQYSMDGKPYTQHGNFHLLR